MGFSWGFVLVKALELPAATIAGWRLVIGALALSGALLVLKPARTGPLVPVLAAGLCFGLHQLAFISATHATSIAVVTLIGALQPLLVAVLGRRGTTERARTSVYFWSVVATAGVGLVVFANPSEKSRSLLGDGLAALNLLLYSGFYLFSKRAREAGWSTLPLTRNTVAISLLVVAPVWLLAPVVVPPSETHWAMLAILALLPGNGHLLVNWALPRVSATLGSLVLTAVPLLASLWAYLIFHEPYGLPQLAGMALVAAAIEGARRAEAR